MPCTREAYPHGVGCIRWFGPAGRQPAPTELTHMSENDLQSASHSHVFAFLESILCTSDANLSRQRIQKRGHLVLSFFLGVRSVALYLQKDGKKLKEEKKKKRCLLSRSKALGGTITKVIKRVITKSQQESCNATYSISLSYGIYRKYKKTDKQRA